MEIVEVVRYPKVEAVATESATYPWWMTGLTHGYIKSRLFVPLEFTGWRRKR